MTGRDNKFANRPSRAAEPIRHTAPTKIAKTAASVAYRTPSPAAMGAMTAAVIKAVVDSGPTDNSRDEPKTAYAAIAAHATQSPVAAGRPATVAYAMTWGTR